MISKALTLFAKGEMDPKQFARIVRANPVAVIQHIQDHNVGLTLKGNADALDEVIGAIGDDARATELITSHMTQERLVELLAAQGELGSAAILLVEQKLLIRALAENLDKNDDAINLYFLKAWALKLKDRGDWGEILELEISNRTLFDWLVWACWVETGQPDVEVRPSDGDDEPSDEEPESPDEDVDQQRLLSVFHSVGLDPHEAEERLRRLEELDELRHFNGEELAEARMAYTESRAARADAPKVAEDVASRLDLGE